VSQKEICYQNLVEIHTPTATPASKEQVLVVRANGYGIGRNYYHGSPMISRKLLIIQGLWRASRGELLMACGHNGV
jgi:hypothetical protein